MHFSAVGLEIGASWQTSLLRKKKNTGTRKLKTTNHFDKLV